MVTVSFMVIFPLHTLGLTQGQAKQGNCILTGSTKTERSPSLWPEHQVEKGPYKPKSMGENPCLF